MGTGKEVGPKQRSEVGRRGWGAGLFCGTVFFFPPSRQLGLDGGLEAPSQGGGGALLPPGMSLICEAILGYLGSHDVRKAC